MFSNGGQGFFTGIAYIYWPGGSSGAVTFSNGSGSFVLPPLETTEIYVSSVEVPDPSTLFTVPLNLVVDSPSGASLEHPYELTTLEARSGAVTLRVTAHDGTTDRTELECFLLWINYLDYYTSRVTVQPPESMTYLATDRYGESQAWHIRFLDAGRYAFTASCSDGIETATTNVAFDYEPLTEDEIEQLLGLDAGEHDDLDGTSLLDDDDATLSYGDMVSYIGACFGDAAIDGWLTELTAYEVAREAYWAHIAANPGDTTSAEYLALQRAFLVALDESEAARNRAVAGRNDGLWGSITNLGVEFWRVASCFVVRMTIGGSDHARAGLSSVFGRECINDSDACTGAELLFVGLRTVEHARTSPTCVDVAPNMQPVGAAFRPLADAADSSGDFGDGIEATFTSQLVVYDCDGEWHDAIANHPSYPFLVTVLSLVLGWVLLDRIRRNMRGLLVKMGG